MLNAIVLSLLWLQAQPAATPSQRPTAMIVGRVVDAGTGRPVAGAVVSITGATFRSGAPPRLMTDSQGRFLYRNLAAGSYSLSVSKGGYVTGSYGQRRPEGGSQQVELADGERATDVTIPLWKYGTIAGTIVDEAGQPMVGVQVRALQKRIVAGRQTVRPLGVSLASDDRGIYRIVNLLPGEYVVNVSGSGTNVPTAVADAYQQAVRSSDVSVRDLSSAVSSLGLGAVMSSGPYASREGDTLVNLPAGLSLPNADGMPRAVYPATYHPGTASAAQATTVRLRSGEERTGIDIQMRPVPAVNVSGTVIRPDGPAANIAVKLEAADSSRATPLQREGYGTVTDGAGRFTILNVPAGDYTLRVTRIPSVAITGTTTTVIESGGTTVMSSVSTGDGPAAPLPTDPTWWGAMPLQVGRRDISDLQVALQEGIRFTGRLEFDGTAERPDADRLRRMVVNITPSDESFISGNRQAQVDADGTFKTLGLPGGSYVLRVTSPVPGWTLESAIYQGRDIADIPVVASAGDIAGIVVTFTDRPASIDGSVRGSAGPDPDATVLIFPAEPALWAGPANQRRMRQVRAGKNGAYSIKNLPPGGYYVIAVPDEQSGDWMEPRVLESLARDATLVDVDKGSTKTQDLRTVRRAGDR